jgi:8-oxo-dGTP pyrophosphatase MutT (NUDIX family)
MGAVPMSAYVARMRALVGTDMLHMPSVAAICRDELGRVLLVQERDSGAWTTPGGAIEPDETPEDALRREVEEESGLAVEIKRLVTALGGPEYRTVYSNGDQLSYVALVYEATAVSGTPSPDWDETSAVAWFDPEELVRLPRTNFFTLLLRDVGLS